MKRLNRELKLDKGGDTSVFTCGLILADLNSHRVPAVAMLVLSCCTSITAGTHSHKDAFCFTGRDVFQGDALQVHVVSLQYLLTALILPLEGQIIHCSGDELSITRFSSGCQVLMQ